MSNHNPAVILFDSDGNEVSTVLKGAVRKLAVDSSESYNIDYGTAIALGLVVGVVGIMKFGKNPDIDTVTAPEDLQSAGGLYSGFDVTSGEELTLSSSAAADDGTDVSTGSATGGTTTTMVDAGATFVTDGVALFDVVVNETMGYHGVVVEVTSETVLTVAEWLHAPEGTAFGNTEDYRVVTPASTGASLVRVTQILVGDYVQNVPVYFTTNGVTGVTTSGLSAIRAARGEVVQAGTGLTNAGIIKLTQSVTTANEFFNIPVGKGQTQIGVFTVPAGMELTIKRIRTSIVRASGAAGSAGVSLRVRNYGGTFNAVRDFSLQTGGPAQYQEYTGHKVLSRADVKYTVDSVSDNNTIAEGAFEGILQ